MFHGSCLISFQGFYFGNPLLIFPSDHLHCLYLIGFTSSSLSLYKQPRFQQSCAGLSDLLCRRLSSHLLACLPTCLCLPLETMVLILILWLVTLFWVSWIQLFDPCILWISLFCWTCLFGFIWIWTLDWIFCFWDTLLDDCWLSGLPCEYYCETLSLNFGSPVSLNINRVCLVLWSCHVLPVSPVALFPVTTWRRPSQGAVILRPLPS